MTSEYDTPPPVKRYEVRVPKIRHAPTNKVWVQGENLLSSDLSSTTIRKFVAKGYLKEVRSG